jgi:hypothetical protein
MQELLSHYDSQDTGDNPEQCNTLNEGGSQDHVGTDIRYSFWLTGDRFYRTFTDQTDTDTSANSSQAGAYGTPELGHSCV